MSSSTALTKRLILGETADWTLWMSFVRARATTSGIWDLVNPDIRDQPEYSSRPRTLFVELPITAADLSHQEYNLLKAHFLIYKLQLSEYHRQQAAFHALIIFIHDTISIPNAIYIQKEEAHPWNLLRALKLLLAPRALDLTAVS